MLREGIKGDTQHPSDQALEKKECLGGHDKQLMIVEENYDKWMLILKLNNSPRELIKGRWQYN